MEKLTDKEILNKFESWCNCFDDYTCGKIFTPSFVIKKLQSLRNEE